MTATEQMSPPSSRPSLANGAGDQEQPLVLIVGTDRDHRSEVAKLFANEGFSTRETETTRSVDHEIATGAFDLIILDGRLDEGATGACRRLAEHRAPIIVLSDEADVTDRIIALEVGADDLMGRPFNRRELIARARALLRRSPPSETFHTLRPEAAFSGVLYVQMRVLTGPNGKRVPLPSYIFGLLKLFLDHPGQVINAERLSETMSTELVSDASFRTLVVRLRRKLVEAGFNPQALASVRAEGYALDPGVGIRKVLA